MVNPIRLHNEDILHFGRVSGIRQKEALRFFVVIILTLPSSVMTSVMTSSSYELFLKHKTRVLNFYPVGEDVP